MYNQLPYAGVHCASAHHQRQSLPHLQGSPSHHVSDALPMSDPRTVSHAVKPTVSAALCGCALCLLHICLVSRPPCVSRLANLRSKHRATESQPATCCVFLAVFTDISTVGGGATSKVCHGCLAGKDATLAYASNWGNLRSSSSSSSSNSSGAVGKGYSQCC